MNWWEYVLRSVDVLLASGAAVILAVLGRLTKLLHEDARGNPFTLRRFLMSLPDAGVVGIIAMGATYTLAEYAKVPIYAGVGLGGILGYLGLEAVTALFTTLAEKFLKKKTKDEDA